MNSLDTYIQQKREEFDSYFLTPRKKSLNAYASTNPEVVKYFLSSNIQEIAYMVVREILPKIGYFEDDGNIIEAERIGWNTCRRQVFNTAKEKGFIN